MKNKISDNKKNETKAAKVKLYFTRLAFLLIVSMFYISVIFAQEANPASGGNSTGTGGTVSYSVGQMVYTTYTGSNGSVAQGVQQPFEITVETAIDEAKDITLSCNVYPNPTTDILNLNISNFSLSNVQYYLYDLNGRVLKSDKVEKAITSISMENLKISSYFLKITQGNMLVKTFKIIKN